jgi:HK97 family phage major capsid protein
MDTKALIEERVKLHEDNKALLDKAEKEGRSALNSEEQVEFDKRDARSVEIRKTLDNHARVEAEERALGESRGRRVDSAIVPVEDARAADQQLAFRAWAMGDDAPDEMVAAAQRLGFRHRQKTLEVRALSSVTATQGQNTIPDEMMRAFVDVQKWYGSVRSLSTVWPTATGAPLPIPTGDDTSNTGEIVADGGAITTTADPTFGQVTLGSFKYSSKALIVPWELLQDSFLNLPVYLGQKLGERIARKQNADYTVGGGTTLPFGVVPRASLGKTAAATNLITWDEVIDLTHSVDKAYRAQPSFRLMMHDLTAAFLRKLKDSQNRYLWEVSLQVGQPDKAFGIPVEINNDMSSSFATGEKLVLAGAFSYYNIRDAGGVTFIRADELRVLNGQVVFLAWQRSDGNLTDTTAVKYLRTA